MSWGLFNWLQRNLGFWTNADVSATGP